MKPENLLADSANAEGCPRVAVLDDFTASKLILHDNGPHDRSKMHGGALTMNFVLENTPIPVPNVYLAIEPATVAQIQTAACRDIDKSSCCLDSNQALLCHSRRLPRNPSLNELKG